MSDSDPIRTIDLTWHRDEPLSVHLLATDDATIVFGGGVESAAEAYASLIDDHDVDVIVVEHGDPDHYGAIPAVRERTEDILVAVPEDDASFLTDEGIEVDVRLKPDEEYWGVRTISAPGHTPGNMAYVYERELIAGDTVAGSTSFFAAPGSWSGPLAVMTPEYNHDDELARESVAGLLEYEFERVFLTHGANVEADGPDAVRTLVEDLRSASA